VADVFAVAVIAEDVVAGIAIRQVDVARGPHSDGGRLEILQPQP
jgi:hypothetical protein